MKIRAMTATFGCLDGATLTLHDGLNAIVLPNESGKSTWAAFLLAMFYGIDTSERSAKGRMAAKTKYQPWNGKPMEGTLEVEHRGRIIVLQRTSQRNKPMSVFRAYEKETGLELPELTAENCGQYFFGVERSVFRRSAFLSGDELTVTQDEALAQRLENLAAAGNVQDNYPAAASKLKLWKNRCRYHQNGLIPEGEAKLYQTEETLTMLTDLRQQRLEAVAAWERCKTAAEEQETAEKEQAAEALAEANALAERTALKAAQLPPEEDLRTLLAKLEQTGAETLSPEETCPPALEGIAAEAILPKAQRDLKEVEELAGSAEKPIKMWLISAIVSGVLAGISAVLLWQLALVFLPLAGVCMYRWFDVRRQNRQVTENREKARRLLDSYGAKTRDDLLTIAMTRRDWLMTRDRVQRQSWETDLLLETVNAFAPAVSTLEEAAEAVKKALKRRRQAAEAQAALERMQLQWQSVSRNRSPGVEAQKEKAAALRLQAETLRSKEEALGGWEKHEARRQRLEGELAVLYQREAALALAQSALESAHAQLAQVYAPKLTGLAGEYLQKLTDGRYDALIMRQGLELLVRERSSALTRPLAALSSGTQDQIWLALRLAMTKLLLPSQTPILLDDALLTFDEKRTNAALTVLRNENRQVILLSCK